MRTIAKIALWLFGGLAAVVAVAAVALIVIDWNWLRATVTERASAASGRAVEIRGDLSVDLWSWTPQVVARDVVFGNAPWAAEPEMVRIAEVYVRLRLMPILAGRLEVDQLRLVKPQVALERRDGKANWELGADTPSEVAVEVAVPKEREDFPVLKQVTVEEGLLTFRDPDLDQPIEVTLTTLALESGGLEDPVRLKAEGSYLDQPFILEGEGESFEKFRSAEEPYDLTLDAGIGKTQLTAEGAVTAPLRLSGVDATLNLKGENLHELFTLFALPLPDSPPYALSGRLRRNDDRWALEGFEGRLGESDLRGDLQVAIGGERPRLVADVASRSFRIEDIESFWGEDGSEDEPTEGAAADDGHLLSDEPLSLPKLRRMDAEVRFQGNSVQSGALRLEDLAADLRLEDGLLTLTPLELGLAEGRIVAELRLDGRREVPAMSGDVDVRGLDINALLSLLGEENAGSGLLQGRLKLAMQGRSMRELGASADGEGALIMSGGRIENILLELIALDLQEAFGQWLTEEEEKVEVLCLAMPTRIESGRFQAQPWILDTTDAIVTISGYVDLGAERVDVELEPHPKDFSLFNYLTSIRVTGDLSEREATTNPIEAVGKIVLKALAAPVMPLFSASIQEGAEEQSVPCPDLRQRLEAAMADGEGVLPPEGARTEEGDAGGDAEETGEQDEPVGEGDDGGEPAEAADAAPDAETVSRLQSALNERGFALQVDGVLGPKTEAAIREFQQRRDLPADGRLNRSTLRQLGLSPAQE
jgi:hypothetical protein